MAMPENFLQEKEPLLRRALAGMKALEAGEMANPDEKRQVGHYWLRTPALAPSEKIRHEIETTLAKIITFVKKAHKEKKFNQLLIIGIGGSALGPQFVADALKNEKNVIKKISFLDNTDPEGIHTVLNETDAKKCLIIVISKSGTTPETKNGLLLAREFYKDKKLKWAPHAVAITQEGSHLDRLAEDEKWLARFPMWDWVGGRTSLCSAVGLVPLGLMHSDYIGDFLQGASAMDEATRTANVKNNPAALLALAWHYAGGGVGAKAMVVLPYKDRLLLFSRYLQQLIMESLGKATDLEGRRVHQGLTVYGNKGSTDQHAYVQQLRDGLNNFFATFIEVQKESEDINDKDIEKNKNTEKNNFYEVEPGVTSGDYLQGFCLGTAVALEENFRQSLTIIIKEVTPFSIGALIALFERAVGLYAQMININAYHQPGVEAGKKAAGGIIQLKKSIVELLKKTRKPMTINDITQSLEAPGKADIIYRLLERLAANEGYKISKKVDAGGGFEAQYLYKY